MGLTPRAHRVSSTSRPDETVTKAVLLENKTGGATMQEPVISFTPFDEDVFGDDLNDFDIWENKGFTISKDFSKIGDWCGDDATVSTISTGISVYPFVCPSEAPLM